MRDCGEQDGAHVNETYISVLLEKRAWRLSRVVGLFRTQLQT